jgi:hypothetical protein
MADILELLRSGSFGELTIGSRQEDIHSLLGQPELTSVQTNPTIYTYGSLELSLDSDRLIGIAIYFSKGVFRLPSALSLTGWKPDSSCSMMEFQKNIDLFGISWRPHPLVNYDDWKGIQVGSGASVYFDVNGTSSFLNSIQLLDPNFGAKKAAERVDEAERIVESLKKVAPKRSPPRDPKR